MKTLEELTQQDVIDLIYYDPITGKCYWRVRDVKWFRDGTHNTAQQNCNSWNSKNAGKEIKSKHNAGYISIRLFYSGILLHRLIWFYQTGEWPIQVDHINGVRTDNRWINLRNVTNQENCKNTAKGINNTSGVMGVYKCASKWRAKIRVNGRDIHLGYFASFEEAVAIRKAAEVKYGFSMTHGRD